MRRAVRIVTVAAAVFLAGVLAPAWSSYRESSQQQAAAVALKVPASLNGHFTRQEYADAVQWQPVFPRADDALLTRYGPTTGQGPSVDLYIAYYAIQTRDKEVVSYRNTVSDAKQWLPVGGESLAATVGSSSLMVREDRLRSGNEVRLAWSFYWIGGHLTASKPEAKLLQAWSELSGGDRRAAGVVVSTMELGDREAARRRLQDFLDVLPVAAVLDSATGK